MVQRGGRTGKLVAVPRMHAFVRLWQQIPLPSARHLKERQRQLDRLMVSQSVRQSDKTSSQLGSQSGK